MKKLFWWMLFRTTVGTWVMTVVERWLELAIVPMEEVR